MSCPFPPFWPGHPALRPVPPPFLFLHFSLCYKFGDYQCVEFLRMIPSSLSAAYSLGLLVRRGTSARYCSHKLGALLGAKFVRKNYAETKKVTQPLLDTECIVYIYNLHVAGTALLCIRSRIGE